LHSSSAPCASPWTWSVSPFQPPLPIAFYVLSFHLILFCLFYSRVFSVLYRSPPPHGLPPELLTSLWILVASVDTGPWENIFSVIMHSGGPRAGGLWLHPLLEDPVQVPLFKGLPGAFVPPNRCFPSLRSGVFPVFSNCKKAHRESPYLSSGIDQALFRSPSFLSSNPLLGWWYLLTKKLRNLI